MECNTTKIKREPTFDNAIQTVFSFSEKCFLKINNAHCAKDLKFRPTNDL